MNDQISNDLPEIIVQALEEMKKVQGKAFSMNKINLAELERRTGLSRSKLRRLKKNNFKDISDPRKGKKTESTVLSKFTGDLDALLKQGVTNSSVLYDRIKEVGYMGSLTTIKNYIRANRNLVPAPRQLVAPQGNRGRRYYAGPGEAFQMDWGFAKIHCFDGNECSIACFAPKTAVELYILRQVSVWHFYLIYVSYECMCKTMGFVMENKNVMVLTEDELYEVNGGQSGHEVAVAVVKATWGLVYQFLS